MKQNLSNDNVMSEMITHNTKIKKIVAAQTWNEITLNNIQQRTTHTYIQLTSKYWQTFMYTIIYNVYMFKHTNIATHYTADY